MPMTRLTPIDRIKREATKLIRNSGIEQPPIDVKNIAKTLGAIVQYEPFEEDISGVLYRDPSRIIIGVSSLQHSNRQRFTIAHEIGHLVLHNLEIHVDKSFKILLRDARSSEARDPLEIDANRFAAELLMPASMIRNDVRIYLRDFEDEEELRQLARRYRVSTQALAFRLANIGLVGT